MGHSAIGLDEILGGDVFCRLKMYSTVQYSTVQYSTVQYSTVQYSTVQYSTVQYSTVQDRTGQDKILYYITYGSFHTKCTLKILHLSDFPQIL